MEGRAMRVAGTQITRFGAALSDHLSDQIVEHIGGIFCLLRCAAYAERDQ
jgi:hypothetical protein